jgi:hypothetical protein
MYVLNREVFPQKSLFEKINYSFSNKIIPYIMIDCGNYCDFHDNQTTFPGNDV